MFKRIVHGPDPVATLAMVALVQALPPAAVALTKPGEPDAVFCGCVQPAGTSTDTCEPVPKFPTDLKLNVRVFPVLPPVTLVGLTVIWPSPLASVNVVCAVHPEDSPFA